MGRRIHILEHDGAKNHFELLNLLDIAIEIQFNLSLYIVYLLCRYTNFFRQTLIKFILFYSRRLICNKDVPSCPDGEKFPVEKINQWVFDNGAK